MSDRVARVVLQLDDGEQRDLELIPGPADATARHFVLFAPGFGVNGTLKAHAQDGSTLDSVAVEESGRHVLQDTDRRREMGLPEPGPEDFEPLPEPLTGHILHMDDDVDIARFVQVSLQSLGYEATLVLDGDVALHRVQQDDPDDLIITDVNHPGIDGIELVRRIRALQDTATTPILILTARASPGDVVLARRYGADDYMVKPFDPVELLAHVRALLRPRGETVS